MQEKNATKESCTLYNSNIASHLAGMSSGATPSEEFSLPLFVFAALCPDETHKYSCYFCKAALSDTAGRTHT